MLRDITIGQHFPGNSVLHRCDPRLKLVATIAYIVVLFVAPNPLGLALSIALNRSGLEAVEAMMGPIPESSLPGLASLTTTPAGMYPKADDMPLDPAVLPRCENVFEAIYNPARTKLMRLAQQAGCHVIGGMAMLVWQAVQAHQYWYGAQFREEDIAALIREMEQRMEGADE